MKPKLIALDLDGTTLDHYGYLSEFHRNAILSAIDAGIEIVIASGRSFTSLPDSVTTIPGINYAIVSNGAAVYNVPDKFEVDGWPLNEKTVKRILDNVPLDQYCLEVIISGDAYAESRYVLSPASYSVPGVPDSIVKYVQRTRTPIDDIYAFIKDNITQLDCINVICPTIQSRLDLHKKLRGDDVFITSSTRHLLEISSADSGKGNGLRFLCRRLGISLDETLSCGNADNDADMLLAAGIGAATADASDYCRECADIIIDTAENGGVGKLIEKILSEQKNKAP